MKKIFFLISLIIVSCFIFSFINQALAYTWGDVGSFYADTAEGAKLSVTDYTVLVAKMIAIFISIVGGLFVILFIWGGISWMMAGGSQDKINKAKNVLTYATIGVFICIAAYSIASLISTAIESGGSTGTGGGSTATTGTCDAPFQGCMDSASCTDQKAHPGASAGPQKNCPDGQICCIFNR